MNWHIPKNNHLTNMKDQVFITSLRIGLVAFIVVALINLINHRPIVNIVSPLLGAGFLFFLHQWYPTEKSKKVRLLFLFFLSFVYLPAAWLTSPGSYSAMSFYAVLMLFLCFIVIQETWEYIFPALFTVLMVILLHLEPQYPERYHFYSDPQLRAFDLSINFVLVSTTLFALIFVLNRSFSDEHQRVYQYSITDPLTNLFNRRYLHHFLTRLMEDIRFPDITYSLLLMDLDHFKKINDLHGHPEGDRVLKEFAAVLTKASRKNDVVIRFGGDEFLLLLMDTDDTGISIVEERIQELFQPVCDRYPDIPLSVSFGRATCSSGSVDEVIKMADDILYQSKDASKKNGTSR
ncbi:diguanylate cyclase (GGDEF) domain-containing protein [Tindallia magadiensis]|uniref:Diguanylate cyclase (GGDEF) domain-containing protein n=1 Tax=Tindallia magadiensis TaxID=69895 RepID=A0A1I3DAD4_9FIRM|nr:GGDEF domain-containing protein [Tindallia magadiensis]SFH83606.1 diguanylate cyclase (GGDEF) domain-containing protein [Tindallia magadiensis]